jgi:hypothetical protein
VTKTNRDEALQLIEKTRLVESKMALVSTFFQTSLYATNCVEEGAVGGQDEDTNRPAFS